MGLKVGTVKLEEYNPKWKDMYLEEEKKLKAKENTITTIRNK